MERPLDPALKEIRNRYPDVLDKVFELLHQQYSEEIIIGSTTDETLQNAYKLEGKRQALIDLKQMFGIYDTRT